MDAVLLRNKVGSLERRVARVRDKYRGNEAAFGTDIDLQGIVVLNLQRACRTAIDLALRLGRLRRLAFPSDTAEIFRILEGRAGTERPCQITRDDGRLPQRGGPRVPGA
jgi:hypothetical protein